MGFRGGRGGSRARGDRGGGGGGFRGGGGRGGGFRGGRGRGGGGGWRGGGGERRFGEDGGGGYGGGRGRGAGGGFKRGRGRGGWRSHEEQPAWDEQPQEEEVQEEETQEEQPAEEAGADGEQAKRGRGGQRREVDRETITYLQRIERLLDKNEFASEEEFAGFLESTYADMEGQEVMLSSHVYGSKIVERLLRLASPFLVRGFLGRLTRKKERVVQLCTDRYSSHVMETVLSRVPDAVPLDDAPAPDAEAEDEGAPQPPAKVEESVLSVCEGVEHSLVDLMQQAHSSHVLRALLRLLSGLRLEAGGGKRGAAPGKKALKEGGEGEPWPAPVAFTAALVKLGAAVLRNPQKQVDFLAFHTYASPVLAALLEALARVDETGGRRVGPILRQILHLPEAVPGAAAEEEGGEEGAGDARQAQKLATHAVGSHLFEAALKVAPADVYGDVYTRALRHRFAELAAHRSANFLVQRALERATHEAQVAMAFDELQPSIGELLKAGRAGVVLKLAEACGRFAVRNKELCKAVAAAVDAARPPRSKRLAQALLAADARPAGEGEGPATTTLGALIVQALLRLQAGANKPLVDSFLAMDRPAVAALARHPAGSRAVEALLRACPGLSPPDRLRFVAKLKGTFAELAGDRAGSHVVEACYAVSDVGLKRSIVEELAKEEGRLGESTYGQHALKACKVQHYRKKAGEWETEEAGNEAKRRVFADLLGDAPPAPKAAKGKKGRTEEPKAEAEAAAEGPREVLAADDALQSIIAGLGFATRGGAAKEGKKRKGRKGRAGEGPELRLQPDGDDDEAEGGGIAGELEGADGRENDPEVEALFRQARRPRPPLAPAPEWPQERKRRRAEEERESEGGAADEADAEGAAPAPADASLSFILDAIGSTAKKGGAKKQKAAAAGAGGAQGKGTAGKQGGKNQKKKKKFSMH